MQGCRAPTRFSAMLITTKIPPGSLQYSRTRHCHADWFPGLWPFGGSLSGADVDDVDVKSVASDRRGAETEVVRNLAGCLLRVLSTLFVASLVGWTVLSFWPRVEEGDVINTPAPQWDWPVSPPVAAIATAVVIVLVSGGFQVRTWRSDRELQAWIQARADEFR